MLQFQGVLIISLLSKGSILTVPDLLPLLVASVASPLNSAEGMRYGVVGVECSVSAPFFKFMPRVARSGHEEGRDAAAPSMPVLRLSGVF